MGLKVMKLLNKILIMLFLLALGSVVSAASVWDGSVSIARYGYLPQKGLYAASNAFPANTAITVTNPETGVSVDVVVIKRLDDNSLFLALSSEAADIVGVTYGTIFHGNITKQSALPDGSEEELSYNPDPDLNPAGEIVENPELALIEDYITNELGGTDSTLVIPEHAVQPEIPEEIPELSDTSNGVLVDQPAGADTESIVIEQAEPETTEVPEVAELIPDNNVDMEETIVPAAIPDAEVEEKGTPGSAESEILPGIDDIPVVANMPVAEVYSSESDSTIIIPEPVEAIQEKEIISEIPEENDIPVADLSGSVEPPVTVSADFNNGLNIPSLPVKEIDTPVVTVMDSVGDPLYSTGVINSVALPELPIIGVEESVAEDIPVAVSMDDDVVLMDESTVVETILPELVIREEISDIPVVESLAEGKPGTAEKTEELVSLLPEVGKEEPDEELELTVENPIDNTPVVDELVVEVPESDETEEPSNIPEIVMPEPGVEIVLEPSDPRPPVVEDPVPVSDEEPELSQPVVEVEAVEDAVDMSLVDKNESESIDNLKGDRYSVISELQKDSYYLQLGAYREEYTALNLADQLGEIYPVTVYVTDNRDSFRYKVMVGPLGLDESGVILYNFKSMGFQDAFLRKGL